VATDPLVRIRAICLALAGASEKAAWGEATFRIRGKMFAMTDGHNPEHGKELSLWCNAPPGFQQAMVNTNPRRFFVPKYVGHKGWVAVRIDRGVDWSELGMIIEGAYRVTAPGRVTEPARKRQVAKTRKVKRS
jgi:predicted DNA-binding protein (MmcQ/YjbR family)